MIHQHVKTEKIGVGLHPKTTFEPPLCSYIHTTYIASNTARKLQASEGTGYWREQTGGVGLWVGAHLSNDGVPGVMLVLLHPTVKRVALHRVQLRPTAAPPAEASDQK